MTLGWFFIIGRAIAFAFELNAVIYERFGSITTAVFSLPVPPGARPKIGPGAEVLRPPGLR